MSEEAEGIPRKISVGTAAVSLHLYNYTSVLLFCFLLRIIEIL
jgi:hypothetical protein